MSKLQTAIVSGRVPLGRKTRVDAWLHGQNLTVNDAIDRLYEYLDNEKAFPWNEVPSDDLYNEYVQLVDELPESTSLDSLDAAGLKERLRQRDNVHD